MTKTGTLRGVALSLLVSLSPIMLAATPAQAVVTAYVQSVAEAAADDAAVAAFYRERDFRPIWTSKDDAARRAAFFRALETVETHGLPATRYDAAGAILAMHDLAAGFLQDPPSQKCIDFVVLDEKHPDRVCSRRHVCDLIFARVRRHISGLRRRGPAGPGPVAMIA